MLRIAIKIAAIALLCTPSLAFAAIARDTFGIGTASAVTSHTDAITLASGDTVLLVFHAFNTAGGVGESTPTWNGTNMTAIAGISVIPITTGTYKGSAWYIVNPTSGTHNLITGTTFSNFQQAYWCAYTGTATDATVIDNSDHGTVSVGTSKSSSITINKANSWICSLGLDNNGPQPTTSTGVVSTLTSDGNMTSILQDSNGAQTVGSKAYGFSGGQSGDVQVMAVSLAVPTVITFTPFINLFVSLIGTW